MTVCKATLGISYFDHMWLISTNLWQSEQHISDPGPSFLKGPWSRPQGPGGGRMSKIRCKWWTKQGFLILNYDLMLRFDGVLAIHSQSHSLCSHCRTKEAQIWLDAHILYDPYLTRVVLNLADSYLLLPFTTWSCRQLRLPNTFKH